MKIGALALALTTGIASAATVDVAYTVSGTPGDWTLKFNVANNIPGDDMVIYFFGVQLDTGRNIVGSPPNWNPDAWQLWGNSLFGGSDREYNNNWIDFAYTGPYSGESLSGFEALYAGETAPTVVNYFCFAYGTQGSTYSGADAFYKGINPGFEGWATEVPAPGALAALGALGLAAARRR